MGDDAGAGIHPTAAAGFSASAEAYERARPGYPQEAVAWLADRLRIGPGRDVLDLAAGTGKLTRALAPLGARLVAVEPIDEMREHLFAALPDVEAFDGTAEAIPLPDGSVDVVTCGQAFHWFHAQAALAEIHRVLRPGGGLALVWNVRDLSNPLQARIQEILAPHRAGAVSHLDIDPPALLAESGLFGPADTRRWLYEQRLSRAHLVDRIASTSFVATLDPDERAGVLSLVLEAAEGHPEPIAIPYVTEAYAADRLEPGA
ncbi:MAG TPA: class I SAM-dependent methyltransferase [Gaiellaceae bacterium]|nr:class I SAM-dependent methyltransferase [Gaiellaceae bacterium]